MKERLIHYGEALVIILATVALWFVLKPHPAPVGEYTKAPVAPAIKHTPQQDIHPKKVKVYVGAAKTDLGLSAAEQNDPNIYVLGAAKLPNDTHPITTVAVYNADTGQTHLEYKREPLPWLAVENRGAVGIGYGLKNGQREGHLFARAEVFQIKAAHFGGGAHWFTDGTNMIELTVAGEW